MPDFLPTEMDDVSEYQSVSSVEDGPELLSILFEEVESNNEPHSRHKPNKRVTIAQESVQQHLRADTDPEVGRLIRIGETLELDDGSFVTTTGFQWILEAELPTSYVAGGNRSSRSTRRGSQGQPGAFIAQSGQENSVGEVTAADISHVQHHQDNDLPEASSDGGSLQPEKRGRAKGMNRGKGKQRSRDPRRSMVLALKCNGNRVVKATRRPAKPKSLYSLAVGLSYVEIPPVAKFILGEVTKYLIKNSSGYALRWIEAVGSRWVKGQ